MESERREVPPRRVSAQEFHTARLEHESEQKPAQKPEYDPRGPRANRTGWPGSASVLAGVLLRPAIRWLCKRRPRVSLSPVEGERAGVRGRSWQCSYVLAPGYPRQPLQRGQEDRKKPNFQQ